MRLFSFSLILLFIISFFVGCDIYSPVSDSVVLSSADNSYDIVKWFNQKNIRLYYFKGKFDQNNSIFLDTVSVGTKGDSIHALIPLYDFFNRLPEEMIDAYKYHSIYIGDISFSAADGSSAGGVAFSRNGKIAVDNSMDLKWTYKTIAHEFGHIVHFWGLGYRYSLMLNDTTEISVSSYDDTCRYRQDLRGKDYELQQLFRYSMSDSSNSPTDYISDYSQINHFENFAEHFDAVATGAIDSVDLNKSEVLKSKVDFIRSKVFNGKQPPLMPEYY